MDLPLNAKTLEFRCKGTTRPRIFVRCDVTTHTLALRDTDIRTHLCLHDGITTQQHGIYEFGFSIYEDAASAEAAFRDVMDEVSRHIGSDRTVLIDHVPGHLTARFRDFIQRLDQHGISYREVYSGSPRSSIRIE
jgi:hypothetical protein